MKSMRWVFTYIFMASIGLWFAFFMSLKFMAPAHSQTPEAPTAADLPPEFEEDPSTPPVTPPGAPPIPPPGGGRIPPPPQGPPPGTPGGAPPLPPAGAGGAPAGPGPVPGAPPNNADQGSVPIQPANPQFAGDEQYIYDPTGRRDPFKPYRNFRPTPGGGAGGGGNAGTPGSRADLTDPLQRFDVNRFAVIAIIWEVRNPKAMVKDPEGATYMISKNTKIGRNGGHVITIREGEVVVVETVENEGLVTKEVRILELKK